MKRSALIILMSIMMGCGLLHAQGPRFNLMPYPAKVQAYRNILPLTQEFTIAIQGHPDARLYDYTSRVLHRMSQRTALFFQQGIITPADSSSNATLQIIIERPGVVKVHEDEHYTLAINQQGIRLKAVTDIGAMRGLETLLQLIQNNSRGYYFPGVAIDDAPRFTWRGVLIDVCRHYLPAEVLMRNIDAMAAVKMNVLHLHLTEDQGFRIESKIYPRLHELGSDGQYYTQTEMKSIIRYAADRGIRVVPEFDIPGHATSWFAGYPELASAPGQYTIERGYGVKDPTLDPTRPITYKFLEKFLGEMATLFPDDYMHIGGDENNGKQWDNNEAIQEYMKAHDLKDNHALQAHFNQRVLTILQQNNKHMVGWDEIFQPGIPNDIVIQSWRGKEALLQSARKGYQAILSNGYYIDLCQPTHFHYLNDPIPTDAGLTPEQEKYILGGEATMWAEIVTEETVDSRIWPRTAAIAERLWSPASENNVDEMYRRLEIISIQLEEHGLTHLKNYDMMLRRLCQSTNTTPLRNLIDVMEPVERYNRHQYTTYSIFSPFTRGVDAARCDAALPRHFMTLVKEYLQNQNSGTYNQLVEQLTLWQNNHKLLKPIIDANTSIKELEKPSLLLSQLAGDALHALKLQKQGKKTDAATLKTAQQHIAKARKVHAEMEIRIADAIEMLIHHDAKK